MDIFFGAVVIVALVYFGYRLIVRARNSKEATRFGYSNDYQDKKSKEG